MNPEVKAIRDLLLNEPMVTNLLDSYAGEPAVFDSEAPQDFEAQNGYIVIQETSVVPWDTHSDVGYDAQYDVRCYAPRTGSMVNARSIAVNARRVLHRARPSVNGRASAWLWVGGGPSPLPLEENMVGLLLSVRVLTQDTI